ncbi:hypothetical protein SAMN04489716_9181 [Actinoplanes derwentensis]|uniref:Uncharacterized protein n=1 Tax=Actinoplanes derwentensis TaxID=113562 RepID=A0A1H2DCA9_9ACTN|nr:hypothetical protein SAMN04489716_9181 [Actinoplanes derwentensis]
MAGQDSGKMVRPVRALSDDLPRRSHQLRNSSGWGNDCAVVAAKSLSLRLAYEWKIVALMINKSAAGVMVATARRARRVVNVARRGRRARWRG